MAPLRPYVLLLNAAPPPVIPLETATGQATATLDLAAPGLTPIVVSAVKQPGRAEQRRRVSAVVVGLSPVAEAIVPLSAAAATSTGTLALSAQTQIALETATALADATLALTAPTVAGGIPEIVMA